MRAIVCVRVVFFLDAHSTFLLRGCSGFDEGRYATWKFGVLVERGYVGLESISSYYSEGARFKGGKKDRRKTFLRTPLFSMCKVGKAIAILRHIS